jgi:tetratricopeptide (TPR) repeat protein
MNRLRKLTMPLVLVLVVSGSIPISAHRQNDKELFQGAKILIFDKEWEKAQERLEELLEDYPDSPWYSEALFYLGRTLEGQKGKEKEALDTFKKYLMRRDVSEILIEEAETSIIDLSTTLYEKGRKSYLKEVKIRLYRPDDTIRYYAAFKLSYLKDKGEAEEAIPVLKEILKEEKDQELKDKAKIALLRLDPGAFKDYEGESKERRGRMLKFRVINRRTKEDLFKFNVPWALADLALANIPEEAKNDLRKEGYNLDRITRELVERGEVIEIETKDVIIKIWID